MEKRKSNILESIQEAFARAAQERGVLRLGSVTCTLRSGRKFRYELGEYPIALNTTPAQAKALAERIVREKYVHCLWDQIHPGVNSEHEIYEALLEYLLAEIKNVQRELPPR